MVFALHRKSSPAGFSLVELLVCIAVLGILVNVGILQMTFSKASYDRTRDKRNAQELAGICTCAQAAGLDFTTSGDLDQTIRSIITGGSPADGAFSGRNFSLKGLNDGDIAAVK